MSEWLEFELTRELQPVGAPEGLWGRVQAARRSETKRGLSLRFSTSLAITAAFAVVLISNVHRTASLDAIAARELAGAARVELHSSDPAEIAGWLRREAGVDVAIPQSTRVQLEGARVVRQRGVRIGEVAYRVGDETALLLVAQAGAFHAPSKHGGSSWQQQQQVYALAFSSADRPLAACVLCHANL
jgi:hypothetical protein